LLDPTLSFVIPRLARINSERSQEATTKVLLVHYLFSISQKGVPLRISPYGSEILGNQGRMMLLVLSLVTNTIKQASKAILIFN